MYDCWLPSFKFFCTYDRGPSFRVRREFSMTYNYNKFTQRANETIPLYRNSSDNWSVSLDCSNCYYNGMAYLSSLDLVISGGSLQKLNFEFKGSSKLNFEIELNANRQFMIDKMYTSQPLPVYGISLKIPYFGITISIGMNLDIINYIKYKLIKYLIKRTCC